MAECMIWGRKIHVEVPLLLAFFGFTFADSVKTNLIIFRTCYVILGYNESECALLGSKNPDDKTADLEKIVEPYASVINVTLSTVESVFTVGACLLVGPWSDRFGRRPILITPVVGFMVTYLLLAVFSSIRFWSPWYIIVCAIPVMLTGGFASYLTVLLCYISDVTSESNRGLRMGIFEGVLTLGIMLGNLTSSYVFYALGYPTVFGITSICFALALWFTIFWIPESVINRETENPLRALFHFSNFWDMFKTTFKKRPQYERCTILCCVLLISWYILVVMAESSVMFLYVREKFHWSLQKYNMYNVFHNGVWIVSTIVGVYLLNKRWRIPETLLILVSYISLLNGSLVQGLATQDYTIYLGSAFRSLGAGLSPMIRSLVTKIVPTDEVGKILSLIVVSESICTTAGPFFYTYVYNRTIQTDPSVFNFVSVGFYAIQIVISILVIVMRTCKQPKNEEEVLINEEEEEIGTASDAESLVSA